jgi:hypothetical protein
MGNNRSELRISSGAQILVAQHVIAEFWQWFQAVSGQFGERFENQHLIDELDARIVRLGKFAWEIGPGVKSDHNSALVLTPSGDTDLLTETRKVIKAAPECAGWEFYSAKPPKKWQRKFVLQSQEGDFSVDASRVRYVLLQHPDGVFDLLLAEQNMAALPKSLQQTAAEVLLDGELGEEVRMETIHSVEIVAQFNDDLQHKSSPIEFLAKHLHSLVR